MNLITWDDAERIRTSISEHIVLPSSNCIDEKELSSLSNLISDMAEKVWVFVSMTSVLVDKTKKFALSVNDANEGLMETEPQFAFSQLALALQMLMDFRIEGSFFYSRFPLFLNLCTLRDSDQPLHLHVAMAVDTSEILIPPLDAGFRLTSKFYQYGCTKKTQPASLPFLRYIANLSYKLIDYWRISINFWINLYALLKKDGIPGIPFDQDTELFEAAIKRPPQLQMLYTLHYLNQLIEYKNAGNYDSPSLEEMIDVFEGYKFPE